MLHEATGIAPPLDDRGLPMAMIAGKGNVIVEVADMADAIPEALRGLADVYEGGNHRGEALRQRLRRADVPGLPGRGKHEGPRPSRRDAQLRGLRRHRQTDHQAEGGRRGGGSGCARGSLRVIAPVALSLPAPKLSR